MARKKTPKIKFPKKIKRGDIIEISVQQKYDSKTGLGLFPDTDEFIRKEPPVYLRSMVATLDGVEVGRMNMTVGCSPNPRITFPLKAEKSGMLKVEFQSNQDEIFTAEKELKVS